MCVCACGNLIWGFCIKTTHVKQLPESEWRHFPGALPGQELPFGLAYPLGARQPDGAVRAPSSGHRCPSPQGQRTTDSGRRTVHAGSCSPASPRLRTALPPPPPRPLPAPPFVHVALSPGVSLPSRGSPALPPRGAPAPFLLARRGGACGGTRKWRSEAVSLATPQESGGPVPSACASALGAAVAAPRGAGSGRDGPEPGLAAAGRRPRP